MTVIWLPDLLVHQLPIIFVTCRPSELLAGMPLEGFSQNTGLIMKKISR